MQKLQICDEAHNLSKYLFLSAVTDSHRTTPVPPSTHRSLAELIQQLQMALIHAHIFKRCSAEPSIWKISHGPRILIQGFIRRFLPNHREAISDCE